MKEKSIFLEKEGHTPKNKVLDFLIVHQDFDYSLKEMVRYVGVSYPSIKQLKKELIRDKWITLTRKIGKAQMYKLNLKSKKVQKFIEFFWSVVSEEVEKQLGIKEKKKTVSEEHISSQSPVGAVAVSEKNI